MRSGRRLLFLALTVILTSALLEGQITEPWFGVWDLDLEQSPDRGPARYRRVVFGIEPLVEGVRVRYDMIGLRGGRTHIEWDGAFDGNDYMVQGVDYVLTNAYRRVDERTYEIVVKVDGQMAAVTRAEVSEDLRVLTAVTTEYGRDGDTLTTTSVYTRRETSSTLPRVGSIETD